MIRSEKGALRRERLRNRYDANDVITIPIEPTFRGKRRKSRKSMIPVGSIVRGGKETMADAQEFRAIAATFRHATCKNRRLKKIQSNPIACDNVTSGLHCIFNLEATLWFGINNLDN